MYPLRGNNVILKITLFLNSHFQLHITVLISIQSLGIYLARAEGTILCRGELADNHCSKPVVPKMCSAERKGSAISSQGISGCISVMVTTLKFTYFFKLKDSCFVKNNSETSLIGDIFISYDR